LNTSILEGKDILHMAAQDFQRRIDTPFRHMEGSHHIIKGDFITYLLPPEMQPSNPLREWHGKVEATYPNGWVLVTILDKGYAGETEIVKRTEILTITKEPMSQELWDIS
jgi:hypothetical protein